MALQNDNPNTAIVYHNRRVACCSRGKLAVCGAFLLLVWCLAFSTALHSSLSPFKLDSFLMRSTALGDAQKSVKKALWPPTLEDAQRHDQANPRTMTLEERKDTERKAPICAHNFFHVLMPCRNVHAAALQAAVSSVIAQNYSRFHLYFFDDASDKEASVDVVASVCNGTVSRLSCVISKVHGGPGYSKFQLFSRAYANALPQDVFLIVDGDDFLHSRDALAILNSAYQTRNCWNSWGSMKGKYNEEQGPLPPEFTKGEGVPLNRKTIKSWIFSHPRSFKAFLWPYMEKKDFQYQNGTWLIKATDRCFIYSMLELSGARRSCYVKDVLYNYVWGSTPPSAHSISSRQKKALFKELKNRLPRKYIQKLPKHVPRCPR